MTANPGNGLRVLYVSPLKALNYDIERNLRGPLAGLDSKLRVGIRTGDTSAKERRELVKHPPDILITTPESLFLMLTSAARETLRGVETVIVDEVHAVAGSKRGAHLALSLERLQSLATEPIQRIGLSATQRPLEEIGRFVSGNRPIRLVDAGTRKPLDLQVVVPVEDMREPGEYQSIWPSIYPELLKLVEAHRSTIVFVNNRRLAERLALRLNELAEKEIARAHHGSLAREQRTLIEEDLKAGRIPCLVATSSLELGIDMGAVDLVIQVESPKSVARGLQRIGRAGHELNAVSKGRIFPKFRADLLESAVVARAMRAGDIEETQIPRNPLDVLAQQIVAIAVDEEIAVDDLHDLVRRAYPFAELSRSQLENVLDMLAGRYPSDEFAELRPRIVWDRTGGVIRARDGARGLVVTNAGTIPDRGLFGVFLVNGGGRVGELDEEMVYEARTGDPFLLGASTWRIEELTRDRVVVSPAPGLPGAVPFWKGEGVGRPYELGQKIGAASRELSALGDDAALARIESDYLLDEIAARNLLTFLRDQADATGAVPSDRTIVVERFRDEIGDWRVCILTPFGGRVHAPWAMAIAARVRESLGVSVQSIWSDDGIALHFPDADVPPTASELLIEPGEIEDLVVAELGDTALFGARFRENAARSLLIPRRRPGERTPLWQQRLKAQSLLQVARRYGSFPVVLETYRECLQDVFDLPALRTVLTGIQTRRLDLVEVETGTASPFSSSLPFDYVATYVRRRTPPAERRAQALSLDRDLLRELLGQEELRDLLDPDALEEVERQLRGRPRTPDELHDQLRLRGDLRAGEYDDTFAQALIDQRRAVHVRIAGEQRLIAAEDAGRYRDGLGVMPPAGLPDVFLEGGAESLRQLVLRFAKGRGPFTTAELDQRFGRELGDVLAGLEREELLIRGELRPGGTEREWCDPDVLRRLRRASLAALRKEVEPVEQEALARFLPSWSGIDRRASLREALVPLQALPLPVSLWESEVLPRRVPGYRPEQLDALCATGEVVWVGAGSDRVALYFREDAAALGQVPATPRPEGDPHDRIRSAFERGALFWFDLLAEPGLTDEEAPCACGPRGPAKTNDARCRCAQAAACVLKPERDAPLSRHGRRWSPPRRVAGRAPSLFAGQPSGALAELRRAPRCNARRRPRRGNTRRLRRLRRAARLRHLFRRRGFVEGLAAPACARCGGAPPRAARAWKIRVRPAAAVTPRGYGGAPWLRARWTPHALWAHVVLLARARPLRRARRPVACHFAIRRGCAQRLRRSLRT